MTGKTLVTTSQGPLLHLFHRIVFAFASLLLVSAPASAELLEMADIIARPQHYDRKEVVVMGQVNGVQAVTDKQGQPAFQFFLKDNAGTLKVISRSEVREGDQVIVEGTFTRRRQGGRIPVYNEVNAVFIRPLNQFEADLVG
jgi:cytochrome c-type biogenesis protein CcmE